MSLFELPSQPVRASRGNPSAPLTVATDGSCLKNPGGASGWAWYVDKNCWAAGGIQSGTNQQAELMAIVAALRTIPGWLPLRVRTDSQYALNVATKWMAGWKARNWRKADGQPVMNLDLIQDLDRALTARSAPVTFEWVRGHRGDPMNEAADALCYAASTAVKRRQPVAAGPGWVDPFAGQRAEFAGPEPLFTLPEPAPPARPDIPPLFPDRSW